MKFVLAVLLCVCVALPMAAVAQAPDLTKLDIVERHTPDGPVALVDNSPVSREDFISLYQTRMEMLKRDLPTINNAIRIRTGYQCIGDLVKREILYVEAKKRGLSVSDSAVEARLKEGVAFQAEQARHAGLEPLSEADLLAESGKTRADLLGAVRKSMLIEKMEDEIAANEGGGITQAEIQAFYDSRPEFFRRAGGFHLQQIFVQPKPSAKNATETAWESARQAVEKGLARIRAGESFEGVARDISESGDRRQGGDMGVIPESELPDFLVAAVRSLKPGELSGVIKSEYGFHIFRLLGTEQEEVVSLSEATPQIREALQEARTMNAVDAYIVDIMHNVDRVKVFLKLESAIEMLSDEELNMLAPDNLAVN